MPFTADFWSFSSALSEKKADRVDREIVIRRVAEVSEESGCDPHLRALISQTCTSRPFFAEI